MRDYDKSAVSFEKRFFVRKKRFVFMSVFFGNTLNKGADEKMKKKNRFLTMKRRLEDAMFDSHSRK